VFYRKAQDAEDRSFNNISSGELGALSRSGQRG
jgi:hypothetical protein